MRYAGRTCQRISGSTVFDEANKLLIPRAVGYSAGLINYFFRGKIDFACDYTAAPCVIKNLGDETMYGTFELYAEDSAGNRDWLQIWPGVEVGPHSSVPVSGFALADDAIRYILVFRGKMGLEEDAVAGKVIPDRFLAMTYSGTYRTRGAGWEILTQGPMAFDPWVSDARQYRNFAQGTAIGNRIFAGFGTDQWWQIVPVWMSSDGGRSFRDISGDPSFGVLHSVTALNDTDLLAGFYNRDPDGYPDDHGSSGIAYSADAGQSWSVRASLSADTPGPGVIYVGSNTVLAAGVATADTSGLVRSTDQGQHWEAVKPAVDGTCPEIPCLGLAINSLAWNHVEGPGSVILAGGEFLEYGSDGIWKSIDSGKTWRKVWTSSVLGADGARLPSAACGPPLAACGAVRSALH